MQPNRYAVAAIAASFALAACESDAAIPTPDQPGPTSQLTIDATSPTDFVYIDLSTGQPVQVADPGSSSGWDIAIRRYEVQVNGGEHGTKGVAATISTRNSDQPSESIVGFTPENRLGQFEAVDAGDIPSASAFASTIMVEDLNGWFTPAGQSIVANADRAWKVRLAAGGHALFRVSGLTVEGRSLTGLTLEYRLQSGGTLGPVQSMTVAAGPVPSPTRISLASGSAVDTDGCTWDLSIDVALTLSVNDGNGCQGGTYPVDSDTPFAGISGAADAPQYVGYLSSVSGPIPYSIAAADGPPFIYGIDATNPHRLIPSYNIYLVRSGDAVYKVQFLSYYNPVGGESGYVTMRSARIR